MKKYCIFVVHIVDPDNSSGYDITVKVNGKTNPDFTYDGNGFINFNSFSFVKGTLIDIHVNPDTGLIAENSISKYSMQLSWRGNPLVKSLQLLQSPVLTAFYKLHGIP